MRVSPDLERLLLLMLNPSPGARPLLVRLETDFADVEAGLAEVEERFAEGDVPLPPYWGGYRVRPETIEFWQGRESRLHDRIRYLRSGEAWRIERLAP